MLLALAACGGAPPVIEAPAPPPAPSVWRLAGRAAMPVRASDAPPFEGARDLLGRCAELRPCAAELWRDDVGGELRLLRRGDEIEVEAPLLPLPPSPWRGEWRSLQGTLGACLGDPLGDRFGDDPVGRRELRVEEGSPLWVITLGGDNRCQLTGELKLALNRDRADTRGLAALDAGGRAQPWSDAGRRVARVRLVAFVRDHAEALYAAAEEEERALLVRHLRADPELAPLAAKLERATAR